MAKKVLCFVFIIVLISFLLLLLYGVYFCFGVYYATIDYNKEVNTYNDLVQTYNDKVQYVSVDNIEGLADSLDTIATESTDINDIIKMFLAFEKNGNTPGKVRKDTDALKDIIIDVDNDIQIVNALNNPDTEWVKEKLQDIKLITEIDEVTIDSDPDNMLDKEGGYSGCVYFSVDGIDKDSVDGNTVVEKGTDGGGAIEIYKSVEDAEKRCDYLSQFDGTVLYSGSYAIVGTMVIRTSYRLFESDQLEMTDEITRAFTRV